MPVLAIKSVGTSCGCSKAYFSDSIINPGASVELRVGYKATDTGHFKKHIVIETNQMPSIKRWFLPDV